MDIFAVVIICSLGVDCVTVHDRLAEYITIEQCIEDIPNLKKDYKTNLITCRKGDIIKDKVTPTYGA